MSIALHNVTTIYPPEVAGYVVPLDAVLVLVVEHGQARLVVELLQTLDGETAGVLHLACSRHVTRDTLQLLPGPT